MKLLVDTCTFLWVALGDPRLSGRARALIADGDNDVFLSAASAWEISVKHGLGRLSLPAPPSVYIPDVRTRHRIEPLPIDEEAALALERLPPLHHDPFDRILICQAIVHGLVLLTPDEQITRYPIRTAW